MLLYLLFIIILILVFVYYLNKNYNFIFAYPIIILIVEVGKATFEELDTLAGFNGLILVVNVLVIYLSKIKIKNLTRIRFLFMFFLIISVYYIFRTDFQSQSITNAISRIGNYLISLSFIFVGYASYKKSDDLLILNKNLVYAALIFIIIAVFTSITQFGIPLYKGGFVFFFRHYQWYFAPLFLLISLIMLNQEKYSLNLFKHRKWKLNIIILLFLIIVGISLMRTTWVIIILGTFIFYFFSKPDKSTKAKMFFLIAFMILVGGYIYYNELFLVRESRFSTEYNVENEGRIVEYYLVKEIISSDFSTQLFGIGSLFDEVGKYNYRSERNMHNLFVKLFFSTGYIGIFMFFTFLLSILFLIFFSMKKSSYKDYNKRALALTLILTYPIAAFAGASGIGQGVSYITINFLYIGIILKKLHTDKIQFMR